VTREGGFPNGLTKNLKLKLPLQIGGSYLYGQLLFPHFYSFELCVCDALPRWQSKLMNVRKAFRPGTCHKSCPLLNSNNDCRIPTPNRYDPIPKNPPFLTVVNTLFACVRRNFTSGILLAKSFYVDKRKWHFYWPSKQLPS